MMCLKHMMLYVVLLPTPAAPPIFILLFAVSAFYTVRPCGYCLILFSILFLSTSPSSPFAPSRTTPDPQDLPLNEPWPRRTWLSFNGGRVWDPSLVGYRIPLERLTAQVLDMTKEQSTEEEMPNAPDTGDSGEMGTGFNKLWARARGFFASPEPNPTTPHQPPDVTRTADLTGQHAYGTSSPSAAGQVALDTDDPLSASAAIDLPLPDGYIDLRLPYLGLGFVLDLNWRRTTSGLEWERAQWLSSRKRLRDVSTKSNVQPDEADHSPLSPRQKGWIAALYGKVGIMASASETAKRIPLFGAW